jgi:hypothetical protein
MAWWHRCVKSPMDAQLRNLRTTTTTTMTRLGTNRAIVISFSRPNPPFFSLARIGEAYVIYHDRARHELVKYEKFPGRRIESNSTSPPLRSPNHLDGQSTDGKRRRKTDTNQPSNRRRPDGHRSAIETIDERIIQIKKQDWMNHARGMKNQLSPMGQPLPLPTIL